MTTFISKFVKEKIYQRIVADMMKLRVECIKHSNAEIVGAGTSFKKEYNISEDILEHLIEAGFSVKDMATSLSISEKNFIQKNESIWY